MRIIIENQLFKILGGTETIAIATYNMLKERGHDVFFFATQDKEYYEKDYIYTKYFPKNVYGIKEYLKNPIGYYWNFEAVKKFENMIEDVKPDLIHFNSLISPSILSVIKKKKIPSIMTFHMMPSCCPSTKFLYKNQHICNSFKCKNGNYFHCLLNKCRDNSIEQSLRKTILSYVYAKTHVYDDISCFLCPSNALRDYVRQSNIIDNKEKIITINNFLIQKDIPSSPNYDNNGYFLFIGRLSPEKGVHFLLQAIKELPKDIKFHIVGTGSQEKFLKSYSKKNQLTNVEFLGFKNREEIQQEYQNCIATILPCNWFEIFGMTNIEAAFYGKPTIASNIGAIPEIVEHNKTGLLFEPTNVEALKECILNYWYDKNLVIEQGKNAYKKANLLYTEDRYYDELIKIYNKVIERNTNA